MLSTLHTHPYRYALITGMVLMLVGATTLYSLGYRPGPDLTFVRTGSVVLTGVPARGVIYVDELRRTTSNGDDVSLPLVPGTHLLIVDAVGDYPWSDIVTIVAKKDTVVRPILIAKNTEKSLLTPAEAAKADALFLAAKIPDSAHPISIGGGCAMVTVQNNQIVVSQSLSSTTAPLPTSASGHTSGVARTASTTSVSTNSPCNSALPYLCVNGDCSPSIVFSPHAPITSVLLYPGRTDALIVAYGNTVAALEIDPEKPQYFAPIFEGTIAAVISDTDHSIILQTQGHDYRIALQ
jgi:hypothetical protein